MVILGIGFFIHRGFISIEQHELAAILFIIVLVWSLFYYYGHFLKEKRTDRTEFLISIFAGLFATIFVFALIYSAPCHDDSCFLVNGARQPLDFPDALYFSTVTITTLGYGDIAPLEIFRYFAMTEVLLGIIFTGTIVFFYTKLNEKRK